MKRLTLLLVLVAVVLGISGCNTGEVSQADLKRDQQAQADYVKKHPGDADSVAGM